MLNARPSSSGKSPNATLAAHSKEGNGEIEIPTMEEIEREHILLALESTGGNRTKTADLLEINVRTLRNKIRQYKLEGAEVP